MRRPTSGQGIVHRRTRRLAAALVATTVLVVTLVLVAALPEIRTNSLLAEAAVGRASSVQTMGTATPYVASTLVLFNNTVVAGRVIQTNLSRATQDPVGVTYDGGKREIFVTLESLDRVCVISDTTNKVVANISVGSEPQGVAYDSGKGEVFVTNYNSRNVSVISDSTNTVVATIKVNGGPEGVAYDSGKGEVFVTDFNQNNVTVISDATNTVVHTIPVGQHTQGAADDTGKGEIFVTNANSDNVSVISDSNNTPVASVVSASRPWAVAYDSGRGEVFVTNQMSKTVSVISDANNSLVATIHVRSFPQGVAYDKANGEVFVTDFRTENVSVISDASNTLVATVGVGPGPYGIAYDSGNGDFYVCIQQGGTIMVLAPGNATPNVHAVPPYFGASAVSLHSPLQYGSCATRNSSLLGSPGASVFSGKVLAGGSACAGNVSSGSARVSTTDGFLGPAFTVGFGGNHTVIYRWQISWNASGRVLSNSSTATVRISMFGNLYDNTTGRWLLGGRGAHDKAVLVFTASGTFSAGRSSQSLAVRFSVTLTAGHQYVFFTGLNTTAEAIDPGGLLAAAHATVNVDTGGDFAKVLSMNVV
jgi:YVTN family beta-propeller protein